MKDLENEVKRQENTLQTLQQAAEECRDLRYQNALLERMLRENGWLSSQFPLPSIFDLMA